MPSRFASRPAREVGPKPFSAEWVSNPAPPRAARPLLTLPSWIPGEQTLSAGLVLVLTLAIALLAAGGGMPRFAAEGGAGSLASPPAPATPTGATPALVATAEPTSTTVEPSPAPTAVASVGTPAFVPAGPAPAEVVGEPGAIFPANRVLAYYGHPHDPNMGILGEYPREELLRRLRAEAANYEAADPSRPVVPAFEVIATVAQRDPGFDGTYILDTDRATLDEYADFAEANGLLLVLDLQIGRGTVAAEIEKVRPLLERPHVQLALDPEFAVAEGQTPGIHIGSLTAEQIGEAQRILAEIVQANNLPPKILIVHQFREDMILGKERLAPMPGVQLVIESDGFGSPELKTHVYNILVRDEPVEYSGIKLFYTQDVPLMSAAEILGLTPSPDLIIYQ